MLSSFKIVSHRILSEFHRCSKRKTYCILCFNQELLVFEKKTHPVTIMPTMNFKRKIDVIRTKILLIYILSFEAFPDWFDVHVEGSNLLFTQKNETHLQRLGISNSYESLNTTEEGIVGFGLNISHQGDINSVSKLSHLFVNGSTAKTIQYFVIIFFEFESTAI